MATDLSSGENGSVSADRISLAAEGPPAVIGPIPTVEPIPIVEPIAAPPAAQPVPVSPETQAKAEAAARIAAQSLGAPNLTKELAQLLAASIAQSQMLPTQTVASSGSASPAPAAPAIPAGTPTNAELASLSDIMAGTQSVRKPLPRFRDDLATLNYTRAPAAVPSQPHAPSHAQPHAVTQAVVTQASAVAAATAWPQQKPEGLGKTPASQPAYAHNAAAAFETHHDDEPMPIPSTWREKSRPDEDKTFSRQLGAALMGLAAGLVVVVPAVLWLAGVIGPGKRADNVAARNPAPAIKIRPIEPPTESATFYANETPGTVASDPGPVTTASMARVTAPAPVDASQQIEQVLVLARQKIDGGDIAGARDLLAGEDPGQAAIAFALAETFDPNMLAAWGTRGVSADVQRAKALYARALDMGLGRAMARLDALR